jgi:hypothetical protein
LQEGTEAWKAAFQAVFEQLEDGSLPSSSKTSWLPSKLCQPAWNAAFQDVQISFRQLGRAAFQALLGELGRLPSKLFQRAAIQVLEGCQPSSLKQLGGQPSKLSLKSLEGCPPSSLKTAWKATLQLGSVSSWKTTFQAGRYFLSWSIVP